jgi:uncharacterized protein with WD repeat
MTTIIIIATNDLFENNLLYNQLLFITLKFQSFGLLDKKSIKIPGIRDFSWSPTDNIIAFWVPEDKDVPARVTLMEIPR